MTVDATDDATDALAALAARQLFSTPHRDRLARGVWIVLDGARFLQVQLVDGLTSYEQRDARD